MKEKVMVIFGGEGSEHEVSCSSAVSILGNLDREMYDYIAVGITKAGRWMKTEAPLEQIKDGSWLNHEANVDVVLSMNGENPGLLVVREGCVEQMQVDCIFPAMHGKYGEDGMLQGLLEYSKIPYVGCGIMASAIGFDKALTKDYISNLNIEQANCMIVRDDGKHTITEHCEAIDAYFEHKYPIFVKPSREGSSVGISKVNGKEELPKALETAFSYDFKLVIEEGIVGREIEVAVLGTSNPKASAIGEIIAGDEFYTYEAKYANPMSRTGIVTDISPELEAEIKNAAIKIFCRLECKGLSRVDFFLREDGSFVFNEINTLPGFTPISMYPQLWQHEGLSYSDLITTLIEDAKKHREYYK